MASQVKQSVKEAKEELHAKKASEGVEVNTPEKGIVRKTIDSIDREMEHDEVSDDVKQLEKRISGMDSPDRELSAEPANETESSGGKKGSLLSRIASKLGLTSETDKIEASPVPEDDSDESWESPRPEFDEAEELEDTIDAPEEIGEYESLEDMPGHTDTGEAGEGEQPVEVPVEPVNNREENEIDVEAAAKAGEPGPGFSGTDSIEASGEAETAGPEVEPVEEPGPDFEPDDLEEGEETGKERADAGPPDVGEIGRELRDLEHRIVEEESRELAKINELEQRVERLELDDDSDLEQRIARLENRLESIKTPQQLDDRLTELEDLLMNPDRHLEDMVGDGLKKDLNSISQTVREEKQRLEAEIERLGKKQETLENSVKELTSGIEELRDSEQGTDEKVERLWEAMDEELASLENQIHDNKTEVEDLMSTLLDLSELVKQAMNQ